MMCRAKQQYRHKTAGGPDLQPASGPVRNKAQGASNPIWHRLATNVPLGRSNDAHEREAERVADRVTGLPEIRVSGDVEVAVGGSSQLHRHGDIAGKRMARGSARAQSSNNDPIPASGTGVPLASAMPDDFEPRFERDLSGVRLHLGADAQRASASINARAFTIGNHIFMGAGEFRPESASGCRLIAHELTHVVQQAGGAPETSPSGMISRDDLVVRRTAYCDESGSCWEEDPIAQESRPLDYTPADAVLISSAPDAPLLADVEEDTTTGVPLCDEHNQCWMEDPVRRETRMLREAPPHAIRVSSTTGEVLPFTNEEVEVELAAQEHIARAALNAMGVRLATHEWPYYYRALAESRGTVPGDPSLQQIRQGADLRPRPPDPGNTFQPAGSRQEMTFRHTRPGGNVPRVGTDRISTTRRIDPLLADRFSAQPQVARIDVNAVERSGEQFLRHDEVLSDLRSTERSLQQQLDDARAQGRGKNHIRRLENRLNGARRAIGYVTQYQEGHGVGRIPSQTISGVRYPRLERYAPGAVRGLGWGMLGLSAYMSWDRIRSARPEKQRDIAAREVAGFAADLVFPTAGVYASHGVRTAQEGLQPMSLAFPTPYTWLLEAWIGDELVRQDPEGAALVQRAYTDPDAAVEFWERLAGMPY